jgi:B-box zinc finger protein
MELICPECMGTLETKDGQSARCLTHGGEYRILFSHWEPPAPPQIEEPPEMKFVLTPGAVCFQHRTVPAAFVCDDCGTPLCTTCIFELPGGVRLCADCANRRAASGQRAASAPISTLPVGVRCVQHPLVQATQQCKLCGAFMCTTCDFTMMGGIHVCPTCATAPRTTLSSRRKGLLIGAYALAGVATFGMALVMSGALADMARTKEGETMLGLLFTFIVLIPAVIGMALGFSAIDRRLANPLSVWVAAIWNVIMVVAFLLLSLIGTFM